MTTFWLHKLKSNNSYLLFICFPLAVQLEPQVIISCQQCFNVVGIYSGVVTCCERAMLMLPLRQGHINHTITCTDRLWLGPQMLLSCISVYTTRFWCPHGSSSIRVHHKTAHCCFYLSDKVICLHSKSGEKITLYFTLCSVCEFIIHETYMLCEHYCFPSS